MPGSRPPISNVQEVRASPPSPSAMGPRTLANKRHPRGAGPGAPSSNAAAVRRGRPFPTSAVLSGLGSPASIDTSVSAKTRATKALMDMGVPVTGDYTDAIRQSAGFAFGPKRMPKQGFAASDYSYPSRQMVVGATLAGTPIVAPAPPPSRPTITKRPGMPLSVGLSPSEDRRRMLSTLQGLAGGLGYVAKQVSAGKWALTGGTNEKKGDFDPIWLVWSGDKSQGVRDFCNKTFGNDRAALVKCGSPNVFAPWTQAGRAARGLPLNTNTLVEDIKKGTETAVDTVGPIANPGGGGTGGSGGAQFLDFNQDAGKVVGGGVSIVGTPPKDLSKPPLTAGAGAGIAVAVAAVGVAALYFATR